MQTYRVIDGTINDLRSTGGAEQPQRNEHYVGLMMPRNALVRAHESFLGAASELGAQDVLPIKRRGKALPIPDDTISSLGFVAFVPKGYYERCFFPFGMGSDFVSSRPVTFAYHEDNKPGDHALSTRSAHGPVGQEPYFDGHMAVGLTFNGAVFAGCSGGLTADGPLVMQLQGFAKEQVGQVIPKGFDWRRTGRPTEHLAH